MVQKNLLPAAASPDAKPVVLPPLPPHASAPLGQRAPGAGRKSQGKLETHTSSPSVSRSPKRVRGNEITSGERYIDVLLQQGAISSEDAVLALMLGG